LGSSTSTAGITYADSYLASFKHNDIATSTKIWGEYTIPDNDTETPQNEGINKFNYTDNLWEDSIARVNFYDDGSNSTKDTNLDWSFGTGFATTSATYRVVCQAATSTWKVYRNEVDIGNATTGVTFTDSTTNLSFKIDGTDYTQFDTYSFVAFKKSDNQNTQKYLTMMQDGDKFTVGSGETLEIKGGGSTSTDITTVDYNPDSGSWSFYNNSGSELTFQEAEINSAQFAAGTVTVLNTILNNETVTSTATLNTDWYLGIHVVDKDDTARDIGNATTTIYSTSTADATIWKHNGTSWGSASTSQFTVTQSDSNATGTTPQPNSDGAIRIREYQKTSAATTYYKYNLQTTAAGFSAYNYDLDYGNYITSVSSTESTTTVDKCISQNWHRDDISSLNGSKPYDGLNLKPDHGSWYAGMTSDLEFSVDSLSVDLGILYSGNDWTATGTTILYATTSASNGYVITAWAANEGKLTTSTYEIIRWPYSNTTPATWAGNCWQNSECGFGYTTDDNNLSGGTSNRFATSTKYAGFATSFASAEPVADADAPVPNGDQHTITYRVSVSKTQEAAENYSTTIYYICTAQY